MSKLFGERFGDAQSIAGVRAQPIRNSDSSCWPGWLAHEALRKSAPACAAADSSSRLRNPQDRCAGRDGLSFIGEDLGHGSGNFGVDQSSAHRLQREAAIDELWPKRRKEQRPAPPHPAKQRGRE